MNMIIPNKPYNSGVDVGTSRMPPSGTGKICCRKNGAIYQSNGVCRKIFLGFKVMAGLVGGPGAKPPDAGKFSKICKKCIILAYFSKKLTKQALIFRAFGRKTQTLGKF